MITFYDCYSLLHLRESLLRFLESSNIGIKGIVYDCSGDVIKDAIISVRHEKTNKFAGKNVTSSARGEYWRLLLPGEYKIEADMNLIKL